MNFFIETGMNAQYEAIEFNGYYKLILHYLKATHEQILRDEEKEVIGWGLIPFLANKWGLQVDLNKILGRHGDRKGLDRIEVYEEYLEISRNQLTVVENSWEKESEVPIESFKMKHLEFEMDQFKNCISYIRDEYRKVFEEHFKNYLQYVIGKNQLYRTKWRVVGFYLIESGQNPHLFTRVELQEILRSEPLCYFLSEAVEDTHKNLKKENRLNFNPGAASYKEKLAYDGMRVQHIEDYEFARLLL